MVCQVLVRKMADETQCTYSKLGKRTVHVGPELDDIGSPHKPLEFGDETDTRVIVRVIGQVFNKWRAVKSVET